MRTEFSSQCSLFLLFSVLPPTLKSFPCVSAGKESACNVEDLGLIPGLGRSLGEGKGYPLQYSGLENSIDCIPWSRKEWDTTEWLSLSHYLWAFLDQNVFHLFVFFHIILYVVWALLHSWKEGNKRKKGRFIEPRPFWLSLGDGIWLTLLAAVRFLKCVLQCLMTAWNRKTSNCLSYQTIIK